jgi:hypothetical protein
MRTILLGLLLFSVLHLTAQRECATQQYTQDLLSADAQTAKNIRDAEIFTQKSGLVGSGSTNRLAAEYIVRIPVVVHVVYNTAAQNISDAQIKSQIDALNRDFRRLNADSINTPVAFKPLAADVQIEFVLATADPKGRATNGIVRKATSVTYWQMDDKIKYTAQGGDNAWDSRYYLNIWVGNTRSLLGYSSVPGSPTDKDGIVINTTAFGTTAVSAPYDKGRTAVHEVGHWLGLKHIWGDALCGDDGIYDTPTQSGFTTSCPTGGKTSSCNSNPAGDMYMNYMDFTNDACLNLFTKGQKERMRSFFEEGAARYSLLFSKGLSAPWTEESPLPEETAPVAVASPQLKLYPNPAVNELTLDFEYDATWVGKEIKILSLNGVMVRTIQISSKNQKISLSGFTAGVYFIQGNNNGNRINQKFIKL